MERPKSRLYYHRLPDDFAKDEKLDFLANERLGKVEWQRLNPNAKHTWLVSDTEAEFESFLSIGSKQAKRAKASELVAIFSSHCPGVNTSRDQIVYDFHASVLAERMEQFVEAYNYQVWRFLQATAGRKRQDWPNIDDFVDYDTVKWDETLKRQVVNGRSATYDRSIIQESLYRPFTRKHLYFDHLTSARLGLHDRYFPFSLKEKHNRAICLTGRAYRAPAPSTIITDLIPNYCVLSTTDAHICFPFYTYDRDGGNRRENITDFALARFREQYADPRINKWDIFHYVYALLHHPGYRERYALDLKRSLPRIPFAPEFRAFARAGSQLADLHLNYETADRYSLEWERMAGQIDFRVQKMLPRGKQPSQFGEFKWFDSLKYNQSLTLHRIPERAFAYRLGNRSALEWVVDQYRVKHDKRTGITHDANDYSDDARYIVDLLSRVITVSLKTMDVVDELAGLGFR